MTNVVQFPAAPQVEPPIQEWSHSVMALTNFGTKTAAEDIPETPASMRVRAVWDAENEITRLEFIIEESIPFWSKRKNPRLIKFSVAGDSLSILSYNMRQAQKRLSASLDAHRGER